MPIMVVVLIWLGVGSLAVAAYVWVREQSRREVMERTIGFGNTQDQRLLRPLSGKPISARVEKVLRRAPSVWAQSETVQEQLTHAGWDSPLAPPIYATIRVATIVAVPLVAIVVIPNLTFAQMITIGLAGAIIGFLLPVLLLLRALRKRQDQIRRSLPDALDLLVICVEAGISLDAALLRVARDMIYVHPDLSRELMIVNRKTNAGMPRDEALRGLWERTGVQDIRALVSSLIQSEKWGTSSSRVLRISAQTLRRKRRQYAEKKAATAPIKMIIPMALLIFPALFVVILGPAVMRIVGTFSGK